MTPNADVNCSGQAPTTLTLLAISKIKKKKIVTSQELVPSAGTPYKLHNQETTVIFSEHLTRSNNFNEYYLFTKRDQLCSLTP